MPPKDSGTSPSSAMTDRGGVGDGDIVELTPLIRRTVAARVRDQDTVDDLVQETVIRLIEAKHRLHQRTLPSYAVVTSRNLVSSLTRDNSRHRRHIHRVIDLDQPERPEEETLRREEQRAVAVALARLSDHERDAMVAHEIMERDNVAIARDLRTSPGAVGVQLARARAKLRVDYLLALRGTELPSAQCRPVLISLSAGDKRRQVTLDAEGHLLSCGTCASLSEPLVLRRRTLAALFPLAGLKETTAGIIRSLRSSSVQVSIGATTAVVAGAVIVAGASSDNPRSPSPPPQASAANKGPLVAGGRRRPLSFAVRKDHTGEVVRAPGVTVQSVPADEGFWIGPARTDRIWVRLSRPGESHFKVRAGQVIAFKGVVTAHGRGFAGRAGVDKSEGAGLLAEQGQHLKVSKADVRIVGP